MYIRRKVFSDTGYDFQPVNDVYNVTMTADEVRLFSEIQERLYGTIDMGGKGISGYQNMAGSIGYNSGELKDYIHKNGYSISELNQTAEGRAQFKKLKAEFEKDYLKKLTKGMDDEAATRFLKEEALNQVNAAKKGKNAFNKAKSWVKNNPKLAAGIAAGTLAVGGGGAYLANRD